MDDEKIIELFRQRQETAVTELQRKYGAFCLHIANRLLKSREDAEECVSEAMFRVWNLIPPERPQRLRPWLGRLVRNISIDRWEKDHALKRHAAIQQCLDDLEDVIPSPQNVERELEDREVGALLNRWLHTLDRENRKLFVRRYWLGVSVNELARELGAKPNTLAQRLSRLRKELRTFLEKEDTFHE